MPSINSSCLSSGIRNEALRLGFSKLGIVHAGPLPQGDRLDKWLRRGLHGEMRYLERQALKRRDPGSVLKEVRSLILLACNYFAGQRPVATPLKGKISRYALGDDYHFTIKRRLDRLLEYIKSQVPSATGVCYVDTGPVMEKAWGAQTSLGWMGKHTNLISRIHGSWFFIAVILLNIDLEPDTREKDYCGTCRRCLDACPTGAIVAPYVLDARLCVSYLTIEFRGSIPKSLRSLIGNRIFGCDDCQDICPWNRFATKTSDRHFFPREENLMPDLMALARLTPAQFRDRFRDSPILRATRDGFVRNVVVALGNSGNRKSLPVLAETLIDNSPLVRAHAAWALGRLASPPAFKCLDSARKTENDATVREEIIEALKQH